MQTLRQTLVPSIRQQSLHRPHPTLRRAFLTSPKQTLTATRVLHYPPTAIYDVISDVASYAQFVPYCKSSTVTTYSTPHPTTEKYYPQEAQLVVGFNDHLAEEFWSRVTCVPHTTVEAIAGATESTIAPAAAPHHTPRPTDHARDRTRGGRVLSHLLTKWTLRPVGVTPAAAAAGEGAERTEVNLAIEYQFANPVYGALSGAAAPVVAEKMIEAFERRVKMVVHGPGSVQEQ